ncbi:hypothetical protein [Nesterenkonia ebinurensis]|uniref:hypothetical protein n=1 Tax=Nesterenkonia ebinurensis TaxID=2608252 RepID=UPI00123D915D|nr:hypothetical protein [Nesterenkonia ebinurensis]
MILIAFTMLIVAVTPDVVGTPEYAVLGILMLAAISFPALNAALNRLHGDDARPPASRDEFRQSSASWLWC